MATFDFNFPTYKPFNAGTKNHISAVESYIDGVFYPASREELVQQAKHNHAPKKIIKSIKEMQEKSYYATIDIKEELIQHI